MNMPMPEPAWRQQPAQSMIGRIKVRHQRLQPCTRVQGQGNLIAVTVPVEGDDEFSFAAGGCEHASVVAYRTCQVAGARPGGESTILRSAQLAAIASQTAAPKSCGR